MTYTFETIGISICFPSSSQGIIFALVELVGSVFNFIQIPLTTAVKVDKSFDSVIMFSVIASLSTVICAPVLFSIGKHIIYTGIFWQNHFLAFDKAPKWLTQLDSARAKSLKEDTVLEEAAELKS